MVPEVGALLEPALRGDHRTVRSLCLGALSDGYEIADLVVDVLAPVQQEVGLRWLTGQIGVAEEHASTAAIDSVLAAVELELPPSTRGAPVICVCAEGEWHAAAARMMALVMAGHGWPVVFLGPSLPAPDLATVARETAAAAVALSTSTVAALPGAARCVRAVADEARPVLVGGQAFAAVPAAAGALGAPAFADPRLAAKAIEGLPLSRGPVGLGDQQVLALDAAEARLLSRTTDMLRLRHDIAPSLRPVMYEAAGYVLGFARAAILLGDRTVVFSHLGWLRTFLGHRGIDLDGTEVLDAVEEAGSQVLDDPCLLHAVIAR